MAGKPLRFSTTFPLVLSLLLTGLVARPANAGGFGLLVELPTTEWAQSHYSAAQLQDALLIVRPFGCHAAADLTLAVKAEGRVDGKRISQPLKMELLGSDRHGDIYAVRGQLPSKGVWILSLHAKSSKQVGPEENRFYPTVNALVGFGRDGKLLNVVPTSLRDGKGNRFMMAPSVVSTNEKARAIATLLHRLSQEGRERETKSARAAG